MGGFNIVKFAGMVPRENPRNKPPSIAQLALDCDLDAETLAPWREPLHAYTAPQPVLSFALFDCCWLTSASCLSYVHPFPSCPYVVRAGPGLPYPQIATFAEACAGIWSRLGTPCPNVAPTASLLSPIVAGRSLENRAYRFTWVNKYDQEGGGSPPSIQFDCNDGAAVIVQLPPCPAPEWSIKTIRIYRLGTPFETGQETSNPLNTEWFLVDEVPCTELSYLDTKRLLDLGGDQGQISIYVTDEVLPPPADLKQIVSCENGMLGGIANGQFVVFSEPFSLHSWPLRLLKQLYDTPVALASVADTLYVATDGRPYTISAVQDCQGQGCLDTYRHREPLPCVSARSMVGDDGAAFYASEVGLVMMSGKQLKVVSEQLFTKNQWRQLKPNTMIGAMFENYYFGFTSIDAYLGLSDIGGIRLRTPENEHIDRPASALTFLSDRPDAVWRSQEGRLYLATGTEIKEWNAGNRMREYLFVSSTNVSPRRTAITACQLVRANDGDSEFTLFGDSAPFTRRVDTTSIVRAANNFNVLEYGVSFKGTAEIYQFTAASSYQALTRGASN